MGTASDRDRRILDFAAQALSAARTDRLMDGAVRLAARALNASACALFAGGVLRASTGWKGRRKGAGLKAPAGPSMVLQVQATRNRSFSPEDAGFLRRLGALLGAAIKRQRRESALRKDRDRLATLVDIAEDAVISIDEEQRIVLFNKGAERIFGYSARQVLGRPLVLLLPEEFRVDHPRYVEEYLRTARPDVRVTRCREVLGRRKDGSVFPAECSIARQRHDGRTIFTSILRDISERRRMEEQVRQAQKMDAIGRLAAGAAHDFGNLMMIVDAYCDALLQRLPPSDPLKDDVRKIKNAGERASGLTRQLLALGRRQFLEPKSVDVNSLLRGLEATLRRLLGKGMCLALRLDPKLGTVHADPGRLEQVVTNLAINARDAMPDGGRLTLETRNVELDEEYARSRVDVKPGLYVLLAATDTGGGMDPETLSHVFEPFFTTKEKGTGLGLPTVYGIVRQSGGHAEVESASGRGTTFRIYLPRERAGSNG